MAGAFSINAKFTKNDLDLLEKAGLSVTVQVDLSHNKFITTYENGRPFTPKPVELDIVINRGNVNALTWAELAKQKNTSAAREIYVEINGKGGLDELNKNNVKVEVPNFDSVFVNPANLSNPLQAVEARTPEAFTALSETIRKSMGMYQWQPNGTYTFKGSKGPRTATP